METNTEYSYELTKDIYQRLFTAGFEIGGDKLQVLSTIHPIISNGIFRRENAILEKERFGTLIALARTLEGENLHKAIIALQYQITIRK